MLFLKGGNTIHKKQKYMPRLWNFGICVIENGKQNLEKLSTPLTISLLV